MGSIILRSNTHTYFSPSTEFSEKENLYKSIMRFIASHFSIMTLDSRYSAPLSLLVQRKRFAISARPRRGEKWDNNLEGCEVPQRKGEWVAMI